MLGAAQPLGAAERTFADLIVQTGIYLMCGLKQDSVENSTDNLALGEILLLSLDSPESVLLTGCHLFRRACT